MNSRVRKRDELKMMEWRNNWKINTFSRWEEIEHNNSISQQVNALEQKNMRLRGRKEKGERKREVNEKYYLAEVIAKCWPTLESQLFKKSLERF
jgi:hypothetical protein